RPPSAMLFRRSEKKALLISRPLLLSVFADSVVKPVKLRRRRRSPAPSHFAIRTFRHSGGRADMVRAGFGLALGLSRGCRMDGLNHHSRDAASQPSPGGTGSCSLQRLAPSGQEIRTWK